MRIAITCYPSVGGSGILASALGAELAARGHDVHFIAYERPVRLPDAAPRIHFHPVPISDYGLFRYPDYTLPLSVKMAQVAREERLDILHVHYAVPHATAALLARDMLPPEEQPRIITTLHGTDTTLLARDPAFAPAIRHALQASDAVTTVSHFLNAETHDALKLDFPTTVIHNFFTPNPPRRPRDAVRAELGIAPHHPLLIHLSNLRPLKRIDLLLETLALVPPELPCTLLVLAGDSFAPFWPDVQRLKLESRLIVKERVTDIEDYLNAADLGLFTSDSESFCLSILEAACFAVPSVATRVGGIPEVLLDHETGLLAAPGNAQELAAHVTTLLRNPVQREIFGRAAQARAALFSADAIVPQYEALYHKTLAQPRR